jgi:TRAP-type C4-dicarboxylate transport system permease small subunit
MKIIVLFIRYIENHGLFLTFSTMLISLTISILSRYVFQRPLSWPDELSTLLFVIMIFLGASASIKTDSELKVNVLYERFPQWRRTLDIILHGVRLVVSIFFIVIGWIYVQVEISMETFTPILQIPVYLIFTTLPIFGLFMAIRSIECLTLIFKGK